jgi:hypothetical protein
MIDRALSLLLLVTCVAGPAHGSIDFTPELRESASEGSTLHFKNGEGEVAIVLPDGWTYRGGPDRLVLTPPRDKPFSEGSIEAAAPALKPFEPADIAQLKEQVLSTLPPNSQFVTMMLEAENTTMPAGNPSFEFMISYQALGKTFNRAVLLVNTPDSRLLFQFTAPQEIFAPLMLTFRRAVMTWRSVAATTPVATL